MIAKLTQSYLNTIKITSGKALWITDEGFQNLRLYVGPSGSKTWYVGYRKNDSPYRNYKLGSANVLTVVEARNMARDFLARLTKGEEPDKKITEKSKLKLEELINTHYKPWVEANRETGKETMAILYSSFSQFFKKPVDELQVSEFEEWRTKRKNEGAKSATINRLMTALKAAINWGVEHNIIESNPLSRIKPLQERDSKEVVRYLTPDERARLLSALDKREARIRAERKSHNKWLADRNKETLPPITKRFVDYLKPLVLLAMNSGIRRGSLLSLKWGDINLESKIITLQAAITKAGKIQRLPMNQTFINTITSWKKQSVDTAPSALVFPSTVNKGEQMTDIKSAWETVLKTAEIKNFRFHDLRHDFASQLVMKGVDLNVVRELLGHTDMKMTLRYAHLAPENKLKAVELLDS